jgi:AbrB family looped-hinge helix DNA binding protein
VTTLRAKAKLDTRGRVVVPAALRRALDLQPGDELIIRVEDGELRLSTRRQALARARRMIRRYIPNDEDLTQGLINDRRAAAEQEVRSRSRRRRS